MFDLDLEDNDLIWLKEKYPKLILLTKGNIQVLEGEFDFNAKYFDYRITDSYKIQIEMKASPVSDLPRVRETNSRIKNLAKIRKIALADLHTYLDGTACLCVKPAEIQYFPIKFCFQKFMQELVVPFFYAQSYFERRDVWPWETYSHRSLGWLEWYFDQGDISSTTTAAFIENLHSQDEWKRIRRALTRNGGVKNHRACLCGSFKAYKDCHQKAFYGLQKLFIYYKTLGIKPK
jgi:hypothetical protein